MSIVDISTLNGRVRGIDVPAYGSGDDKPPAINRRGELIFSNGLPERSEIVRMGRSFSAQIPAASAWTLLITIPTTLSNLALQNPASSGLCYIIDRFWVKAVTSTASAGVITPLAQVVKPGTAMVADDAAVLRTSLSGKVGAASTAALVMASTATGCLTDKWMHFESALQSMTTNIAACKEVLCFGRYIIPPGGSFNINAQESVSGGTAIAGVEWHEVALDLG